MVLSTSPRVASSTKPYVSTSGNDYRSSGTGRALRGAETVAAPVQRLPSADAQRLRTAALSLHRTQKQLRRFLRTPF